MRRRYVFSLAALVLLTACGKGKLPAQNPDPNHIHANIAVWMDGRQVDLGRGDPVPDRMDEEEDHDDSTRDRGEASAVHTHDGVGHVVHSHKPGLTLRDFFASLDATDLFDRGHTWVMFINGQEEEFTLDYVLRDLDSIFLTTSAGSAQVLSELERMTDDACLYSRTCPQRGDPPAEDCVADAEVPCVVPEEDL